MLMGAIAPDMGYFPFGNIFFTNLIHYVRSGDLVNALLNEADGLNEYALYSDFYAVITRIHMDTF